ncbi:hypothetical protein ACHAPT_013558 [Fusarium lateritium]
MPADEVTEQAGSSEAKSNVSLPSEKPPSAIADPSEAEPAPETKYLVAEDNPINRRFISKVISKAMMGRIELGYRIVENGQQAVDAYKQNPEQCRLVFMDIQMPIKGGIEATKEIRNYEKENGLAPAIIVAMDPKVTGPLKEEREKRWSEAGIDTVLDKPIQPQAFKVLIDTYPV